MKRLGLTSSLATVALALAAGSPAHATVLCGVVTGTLSSAGNPWVVTCNSIVNPADTVLLEPGVEMLFEAGVSLDVQGTLTAIGTPAEPINFRSASPTPASGDYGTINVSGTAEFAHATLRHGSGWEISGEFTFDQGEVHQQLDAAGLAALSFSTGAKATVSNSYFDNPGRPIAMAQDVDATFSGLQFASGHLARSILVLAGSWSQNHTWTDAGEPYEIADDLVFGAGTIQTFEPGVLFKLARDGGLWFEDLQIQGTIDSFVIFTSIVDDDFGGDTYGDGPGLPGPGDYPEIVINGAADITGTLFRYGHGINVQGSADLHTCIIDRQLGADGYLGALHFAGGTSGSVTNAYFNDNLRPIRLDTDTDVALVSDIVIDTHAVRAIAIAGGLWHQSRVWSDHGAPYEFESDTEFALSTNQIVNPGVIFKIRLNRWVEFDGLQVNGTAEDPVVFTALTDDAYGGDTYGDGPQPTAAGDYERIEIFGPGSVAHARFRYGSGLRVRDHTDFDEVLVEKQDVSNCPTAGIEFYDVATGSVTNSHFSETCLPVSLWTNADPYLAGITAESQSFVQAVMLDGSGTWYVDRTWSDPGMPYYLWGSIETDFGVLHTFEPGTVFKFDPADAFTHVRFDDDILQGTADQPIIFTSSADDSVGGDTNLDGPSTGSVGDWVGLEYVGPSDVRHVEVRYAQTGLSITGSTSTPGSIRECLFRDNAVGLNYDVVDPVYLTDNQFISNGIGVTIDVLVTAAGVLGDLSDGNPDNDGRNQFVCNVIHAENDGPEEIKAENNWWGHAPPVPALFGGFGPFDLDPYWLDPGPVPLTTLLLDRTTDPFDVALMWDDVAPSCGYRVLRSIGPSGGFADLSGPIAQADFTDSGAAAAPDTYYYLVSIE